MITRCGRKCASCAASAGRFDLIRMFLEIQLQAAFADGELHPNERDVLFVIADELGISALSSNSSCA